MPETNETDVNSKQNEKTKPNGKNKNKVKHLKECRLIIALVKEVLYNSVAQAILKIYLTPHKIIKIFLILCVLSTNGLSSYLIIQTFIDYFSYEVSTTSRTIFETPAVFPKITICNNNQFTTEFGWNFVVQHGFNFTQNLSFTEFDQIKYDKKMNFNSLKYASVVMNSRKISDIDRMKLGHNLSDILLKCQFNNEECNSHDFVWQFNKMLGNCFVFNSPRLNTSLKFSTTSGSLFGLKLALFVGFNENLTFLNSFNNFGKGAQIKIENNSYLTGNIDTINISPGFNTKIAIDRLFKFNLPKPYSNCDIDNFSPKTFNSDVYNLIYHSSYQYDQQLCFYQCLIKEEIKDCNCTDRYLDSLYNSNVCQTENGIKCVEDVFHKKYVSSDFVQNVCLPNCPLECNLTDYKYSISTSRFIGDQYIENIKKNPNLLSNFKNQKIEADTVENNVVDLMIFYSSLSYTISTESPRMNIVSLLSSIGGTLGLLLGISAFSILEIIQVLIEIYFIKKNNNVTNI